MAATQAGAQAATPNINISPCVVAYAEHVPCVPGQQYIVVGTRPNTTIPAFTGTSSGVSWGNSFATVYSDFGPVQVQNFANNPAINTQIAHMDGGALAQFSLELVRLAPNNLAEVFTYMAKRLTPANLAIMTAAFGGVMNVYIKDYSPATVQTAYGKIKPYLPMPYSYAWNEAGRTKLINPPNMYYYDLFLDSYLSGSASEPIAMTQAMNYGHIRFSDKGIIDRLIALTALAWQVMDDEDPGWQGAILEFSQEFHDYRGRVRSDRGLLLPEPAV